MRLKSILLENFRSYEKHELNFSNQGEITVFKGKNGVGKTNILEAVYNLSLGKSFRTNQFLDMIKWGNDFSRIKAEIEDGDNLEVFFSHSPKKLKNFKKNGVSLSHKNFLGTLLTVLFHPEDLNMLYLSPSYRRKYVDIVLSQTDRDYLDALINYNKVLKQRNNLLKDLQSRAYELGIQSLNFTNLEIWDERLIEFASIVLKKRLEFTLFLQSLLENNYKKISSANDKIEIKYISKNDNLSTSNIENTIRLELNSRRQKDIYSSKTTFGPHLDDLSFIINGRNIGESASRGEFRSILLSLKLAEIDYIKLKRKETPVLLLDDVFSELDYERQKAFLSSINGCQVLITGTELENMNLSEININILTM